jgi:hypothetical protein
MARIIMFSARGKARVKFSGGGMRQVAPELAAMFEPHAAAGAPREWDRFWRLAL